MTHRGHMRNGVVVLDDPTAIPDGSPVSVRVLKSRSRNAKGGRRRSLYERLKPAIGKAKGLPPDASVNVDHYLYGAPRRK